MDRLKSWLNQRKTSGTLRRLRPIERLPDGKVQLLDDPLHTKPLLDFSSNDYLALSQHPKLITAGKEALEKYGAGAGAARLMSGDLGLNHELEERIAKLKGKEAALIFGSGYMANTGVIPALVGRGDVIFSDRLNHASIYDGCLLSGAGLKRFRHNNLDHLESLLKMNWGKGRALIVVESVYSMDGDICPLTDLIKLKERYDCVLMVDEAHATGLFGKNGGGMIEKMGVSSGVDVVMGTFGKALGSYGAYVAGDHGMIEYLINRARSFIFSTALPPAVVAASIAAVEVIETEPQVRRELFDKVRLFKSILKDGGIDDDLGPTQIVPILIGKSDEALALTDELIKKDIFATAVRPPTVPENTARIRLSITRHHDIAALESTANVLLQRLNK